MSQKTPTKPPGFFDYEWYEAFLEEFTELVRDDMWRREMPLTVLSKVTGVSTRALSRLLSNKTKHPHFSTIWRVASGLGIELGLQGSKLSVIVKGRRVRNPDRA